MPNYPPGALIPPTPAPLPSLSVAAAGAVAVLKTNGGTLQQWSGSAWSSMLWARGQMVVSGFSGGHPVPLVSSGTAAGTIKSTQSTKSSGFTQPDFPRSLDIAFPASWDGGNLTIHGTDENDAVVTALYVANPNNTVVGTQLFKSITSITNSAVGVDTADATASVSNQVWLQYFLPTGAFEPQSQVSIIMVFWVDLNANTQGWFLLSANPANPVLDLATADALPSGSGKAPNGHTIYFVLSGT